MLVVAAATASALVAVSMAGREGTPSDEEAIQTLLTQELELMRRQDWGELWNLYSTRMQEGCVYDDFVAMAENTGLASIEAVVGELATIQDLEVTSESERTLATYRITVNDVGVTLAGSEEDPDVFVREGGTWRDDYNHDSRSACEPAFVSLYVSAEMLDVYEEINRIAEQSGGGQDLKVVIDNSFNIWPWPVLLHGYRNVEYSFFDNFVAEPGSVVIVSVSKQSEIVPSLDLFGEPVSFQHRYGASPTAPAEEMLAYFPRELTVFRSTPTSSPVTAEVLPQSSLVLVGGSGSGGGLFSQPADLAVDAQGNLFVVDTLNHRVQKFAADGTVTTFGTQGEGPGEFGNPQSQDYDIPDGPWGIAVDADGNIYVADTWNHRIQKFGPDGTFMLEWGSGELFGPRDVAVDGTGRVLVADTGNARILVYTPDGELVQVVGGPGEGPAEFNEPVGVSIASNGNIYVADYWNRRIQQFDSQLNYSNEFAIPSWGSQGIADRAYLAPLPDETVLATDPANARIIVFNAQGTEVASWRLPTGSEESRPIGIAADSNGHVFISDASTSQVVRLPLAVLLGN